MHVLTFLYYLAVHLTPGCGCTLASRYSHVRLGVQPYPYPYPYAYAYAYPYPYPYAYPGTASCAPTSSASSSTARARESSGWSATRRGGGCPTRLPRVPRCCS